MEEGTRVTTTITTTTRGLNQMITQIWWPMPIPGQGGLDQREITEATIMEAITMGIITMVAIVGPRVLQVTLIQ